MRTVISFVDQQKAMIPKATKVSRVLLALFSAFVLVVTFYFAALGLGYALDASAEVEDRMVAALCVLAYVALLVFFVGLLPPIRGRLLFWLGLVGTLLLLPALVACALFGAAGASGSISGLCYLGAWWFLAWPRIVPGVPTTVEPAHT